MNNTDAALDKLTKGMQSKSELGVQASNGTNDDDELQSIKEEVEQLKGHIIDIANTKVNGKYIFNGTNTNEKPVTEDGDILEVPEGTKPVMIEVFKIGRASCRE